MSDKYTSIPVTVKEGEPRPVARGIPVRAAGDPRPLEAAQRALSEAPFSLKDVAEGMGVSYDAVRSWASGRRTPQPENLERLADYLEARAAELLALAEELEENG